MEYKLKDIVTFKPGYAFKKSDMTDAGIDLVKIGNLKNNKVIVPSDVKIKEDIRFKDFIINKNDILMALTGDPVYKGSIQTWVGRTSKYLNDEIAYLNQRVCKLIPNKKIVYGDYLYYWLIRYDKTYEIAGLFHGSANQANISHKEVGEMIIDLPSLDIQRKVSKILSDIDKKINLNNKINNNLHELINQNYSNYLNELDEYNELDIKDIFDFETGVEPGSKNYLEKQEDNSIKFYRVGDMNSECNTFIKEELSNGKLIDENDVVVSFDATIGRIGYGLKGAYSTGMKKISINSKYKSIIDNSLVYAYFNNKNIQNIMMENARGTTILHASSSIDSMTFKYNERLLKKYSKLLGFAFDKMKSIKNENEKLSKLRDTLLPKLMNGEIDLDNIKI